MSTKVMFIVLGVYFAIAIFLSIWLAVKPDDIFINLFIYVMMWNLVIKKIIPPINDYEE